MSIAFVLTGFASSGALVYDIEKIKIEISWLTTGQFEDFGKIFDEQFIATLLEKIGKTYKKTTIYQKKIAIIIKKLLLLLYYILIE